MKKRESSPLREAKILLMVSQTQGRRLQHRGIRDDVMLRVVKDCSAYIQPVFFSDRTASPMVKPSRLPSLT